MADAFTIDPAHTAVLAWIVKPASFPFTPEMPKTLFWFESQVFSIMLVPLA